jgi:hypothetical protein
MESGGLAGEALRDDFGVLVDQDGHAAIPKENGRCAESASVRLALGRFPKKLQTFSIGNLPRDASRPRAVNVAAAKLLGSTPAYKAESARNMHMRQGDAIKLEGQLTWPSFPC